MSKVDKRIKTYEFKILNEPRPGKKLLVLDIDYTIFGELRIHKFFIWTKKIVLNLWLKVSIQELIRL